MSNDPTDLNRHKKVDDHNSAHPLPRPQSFYDAFAKTIQNTAGDLANQIVGAATHIDLAQKFSAAINSQLARQYIKGRAIVQQRQAQGKDTSDNAGLSIDDASAVQAYEKVHNDLPSKIPFVDRDALVREVERHIETKARINSNSVDDRIDPRPHNNATVTSAMSAPERGGNKLPPPPNPKEQSSAKVTPLPPAPRDIPSPKAAPLPAAPKETSVAKGSQSFAAEKETLPAKLSPPALAPAPPHETNSKMPFAGLAKAEGVRPEIAIAKPDLAKTDSVRTDPASMGPARPNVIREVAQRPLSDEGKTTKDVPLPHIPANSLLSKPESQIDTPSLQAAQLNTPFARLEHQESKTSQKVENFAGIALRSQPRHDSQTLNVIVELQGLPFGRQFGRVEKVGPLMPDTIAVNKTKIPGFSKPGASAQPLTANLEHKKLATGPSNIPPVTGKTGTHMEHPSVTTTDQILRKAEHQANTIGEHVDHQNSAHKIPQLEHVEKTEHKKNTGESHTAIHSEDRTKHQAEDQHNHFEQHNNQHAEVQTIHSEPHSEPHSETHSESYSEPHSQSQSEPSEPHLEPYSEPYSELHPDMHPEAHISGHAESQSLSTKNFVPTNNFVNPIAGNSSRPVRVVDTKGAEVSPFAKDHDDLKDSDEQNDVAPKTYVLKGLLPDKQYITGAELAFVAIMALASASRVRPTENAAEIGLNLSRREYVMAEEDAPVKAAISEEGKPTAPRKILLRPQVLVQEGDDLCQMAEALFNDSRYGHLIADLNTKTIDDYFTGNTRVIKLNTRQRLSLPIYQDILQFDGNRMREVSASTLITIVEQTGVDRELLDDALSSILGLNSNNVDPLQ